MTAKRGPGKSALLPVTLRVHGVLYRLLFVKGTSDAQLAGKNAGLLDWNRSDAPTIKIDNGRSLDEQRETLLHELIHAAGGELEIPALVDEEAITGPLSRYLYGILRDNPVAARWLFGLDE
jgi:hypothetical protein